MFKRKAATVIEASLPIETAVPAPLTPDDANIPLLDAHGEAVDFVQTMELGHGLWRASAVAELDAVADRQTVVVAAYSPADIEAARPLMHRFMTIVLSMGVGPQYGSRALVLGAIGYVEASTDRGAIQGAFGDAVERGRTRRLREAAA